MIIARAMANDTKVRRLKKRFTSDTSGSPASDDRSSVGRICSSCVGTGPLAIGLLLSASLLLTSSINPYLGFLQILPKPQWQ